MKPFKLMAIVFAAITVFASCGNDDYLTSDDLKNYVSKDDTDKQLGTMSGSISGTFIDGYQLDEDFTAIYSYDYSVDSTHASDGITYAFDLASGSSQATEEFYYSVSFSFTLRNDTTEISDFGFTKDNIVDGNVIHSVEINYYSYENNDELKDLNITDCIYENNHVSGKLSGVYRVYETEYEPGNDYTPTDSTDFQIDIAFESEVYYNESHR